MEYLCKERSQGGSEGSFGIVDRMPFSGNEQTYFKMILPALLLVTKQAGPIKGLLTAVHSFFQCCPFVHSPVPLVHIMDKGEWSVAERTTFMEYLCNERSQGGSEGSFGIIDGMHFSGNISFAKKKLFKQKNILQNDTSSPLIGYKTGRTH